MCDTILVIRFFLWSRYPFINNVHFFADERVAQALTSYYSLIMKSDFDTFLTPGFVSHVPEQLTFGIQEYAILKVGMGVLRIHFNTVISCQFLLLGPFDKVWTH